MLEINLLMMLMSKMKLNIATEKNEVEKIEEDSRGKKEYSSVGRRAAMIANRVV